MSYQIECNNSMLGQKLGMPTVLNSVAQKVHRTVELKALHLVVQWAEYSVDRMADLTAAEMVAQKVG